MDGPDTLYAAMTEFDSDDDLVTKLEQKLGWVK